MHSATDSLKRTFRENLEFFFRSEARSAEAQKDRVSPAPVRVLAAVSGGADSVFLLRSLRELAPQLGFLLAAVTVDHRLRAPQESGGDAAFVEALCAELAVPCFREELRDGAVFAAAAARGMGTEDAARFLRYRAFASAAEKWAADVVMTGHTASDHAETLVMRFLQGAGVSGSAGIPADGAGFSSFPCPVFRPMLSLDGGEIRAFLRAAGIPWREDASNSDCKFLRNKIRRRLLPLLDSEFPGWRGAVLCGAEKSAMDARVLAALPLPAWEKGFSYAGNSGNAENTENSGSGGKDACTEISLLCTNPAFLSCGRDAYLALAPALRLRFLHRGLSLLGAGSRIPYRLLRGMVFGSAAGDFFPAECGGSDGRAFRTGFCVRGGGVFFEAGRRRFFFGRDIVHNHKNGYLIYAKNSGFVSFPFGTVELLYAPGAEKKVAVGERRELVFSRPLVLRSRLPDDFLVAADGTRRSLKKIFGAWGVPAFLRGFVPVAEDEDGIAAVLGSFLGFPDFFAGA